MTKRTFGYRVRRSLRGCHFKPSLRLCLFEEEFCADLFGFLIALPFLDRWRREPHEIMESWGVYYHERAIVLHWGDWVKFIHMPWSFKHIKHEVQRPDGSWVKFVGCWEKGEPDGRWEGAYPFRYTLKSGEVQERTATIYVDRREWRWKCLRWCPFFARKCQSISINFDDEVGERTGSWKGGVLGTGCDMLKGETPEQTLRRFEREADFR